jgi:N-acetylmuramoyl-L-alanine amidase
MKVSRHRLHHADGRPYDWRPSSNRGSRLEPEFLVIHYTAGRTLEESVNWLARKESRASAHVVIGRDGAVVQMVPFDVVAWHAGASEWGGRVGLNRWSIGIELDNAGRLTRHGSRWRAWYGGLFEPEDVLEATHRHEAAPSGWHTYTQVQLDAALEVCSLLAQRYDIREVLGHDDISPGRKVDPGPAFPMSSFRARILGRQEDEAPVHTSTAVLNIRTGPGTAHETLAAGPLPEGTRVQVVRQQDSWWLVDVLDAVNGVPDVQGWVHHRFLRLDREGGREAPARRAAPLGEPVPAGGPF